MANPQKENGYTAIANEIVEAFARVRLAGEAQQIIWTILRKTYGYNKKEDAISLSQFCLSTGMRKSDVCRAINKALDMNVISKKANDVANIYRINKDFDQWKPLAKKRRGVAKKQMTVSKKANNRTQKSDIQKTVTKDNITKDNSDATASRDIPPLIKSFETINVDAKRWYGNTTQRVACQELLDAYGAEKVTRVVTQVLPKTNQMPYFPTITTPAQLWAKWSDLEAAVTKHKNKKEITKPKVIFA